MSADEAEDGLSILDERRCRCMIGHCTNAATVEGLCDRCFMEYAAARNAYRVDGEF